MLRCYRHALLLWTVRRHLQIFEIPASGSLLLLNAEMVPIVSQLGFFDGVHYVSYTADSLHSVIDAVLDPKRRAAVDVIRRQGQELVLARHMTSHRAAAIAALAATLPK